MCHPAWSMGILTQKEVSEGQSVILAGDMEL